MGYKKIIIVIIILCIIGNYLYTNTSKTIAKFEITNLTNQRIDSLYILPDNNKNNFLNIEANSKSMYNIDMTDFPKADGSYTLFYMKKGNKIKNHFGYYSNGFPLESLTRILISHDTTLVKQEYNSPY